MPRIIVDAVLRRQLLANTEPVELRDESGPVLGRFVPVVDLSQYEFAEPPISDEELQTVSRSEEKTCTTAEVLAYLETL